MAKIALLIGVSEYEPGLEKLPSAVNDVTAMHEVLTHPDMGEFAVDAATVLQNPDRQTMETAIYNLFANRAKDDLVLLYFSGHGVVDESGEFYFASRSTCKDQGRLVPPTAVAARSVRDWLEQSRSQRKVIILDSCFSGAFARGVKAKDSGSVNPEQFLGGKGTAILTASTSTQYALTQDGFDLSIYTHYLVEGIRTGGADQGDDGFIDMEELHAYTSSKVKEAAPAMTPEFYPVKDGYKIRLAKSPKDDPQLKYWKQVERYADRGKFTIPARRLLNSLRHRLVLAVEVAEAIEAEVLQPYREYQHKLQEYEQTLVEALQAEKSLSQRTLEDLKSYQQYLGLRDEDIAFVEGKVLIYERTEVKKDGQKQEGSFQHSLELKQNVIQTDSSISNHQEIDYQENQKVERPSQQESEQFTQQRENLHSNLSPEINVNFLVERFGNERERLEQQYEKFPLDNFLDRETGKQPVELLKENIQTNSDDIISEVGVDYRKLQDLLKQQRWQEADLETESIMLQIMGCSEKGYLSPDDISNFPCADLRSIDQLWTSYSSERFGFSVQKQIWIDFIQRIESFVSVVTATLWSLVRLLAGLDIIVIM